MDLNERQQKIKNRMFEDDFITYLKDVIGSDLLCDQPVSEGIAKKIISENSIANLTENQVNTLIVYGIDSDETYIKECGRCGIDVPWCEMVKAADDGFCSYCQHMLEKND